MTIVVTNIINAIKKASAVGWTEFMKPSICDNRCLKCIPHPQIWIYDPILVFFKVRLQHETLFLSGTEPAN